MTPNPPEDPEAVTGTYPAPPSDEASHMQTVTCVRHRYGAIEAERPISPEARALAMARLAARLQPTSYQRAVRLSVIYTVQPRSRQARGQRTRAYLHLAIDSNAPIDAVDFAMWQARFQLEREFACIQHMLAAHYALTTINFDPLSATLQAGNCHLPPAELRYTTWTPSAQWLGPVHLQPMLDLLVEQPGCSAIEITIEREAAPVESSPAPLRLHVLAYGEAMREAARARLVDEFRGHGALMARTADHHLAPTLDWICSTAAPGAECGRPAASATHVALTDREAGHLTPLPMILAPVILFPA